METPIVGMTFTGKNNCITLAVVVIAVVVKTRSV
jgi:hypothetical protein